MDLLNTLIDASIRGTLFGITLFFWGFALVSIWKWFFGVDSLVVSESDEKERQE